MAETSALESWRGRRILVVEDEYLIADVLREDLERAGATVLGPVGTVRDALALVEDGSSIDAAVLDVNLDGDMVFPVADALIDRRIPFVFATGYEQSSLPERYAHVIRCEKPVAAAQIAAALGRTATI